MKKFLKLSKIYLGKFPNNKIEYFLTHDYFIFIILFPFKFNILRCGITGFIEIITSDDIKNEYRNKILNEINNFYKDIKNIKDINKLDIEKLDDITLFRDDIKFYFFFINKEIQNILKKILNCLKNILLLYEKEWVIEEKIYQKLEKIKDICWRIEKEYFFNIENIKYFFNNNEFDDISLKKLKIYKRINSIGNIINSLEIRGRDSVGISINIEINKKEYKKFLNRLEKERVKDEFNRRLNYSLLVNKSIRKKENKNHIYFTFVYKVAQEIGNLGDNIREIRRIIREDKIFNILIDYVLLENNISYIAHTRWASNGIINIYNCHPVDNEVYIRKEEKKSYLPENNHIFCVLNGDIDNFEELKLNLEKKGYYIPLEISTDTKIIPLLIGEKIKNGDNFEKAFFKTVNEFKGSHAIISQSDIEPHKLYLALKGSGQSLYIGILDDRYVISSEVYGIVEDTDKYIPLNNDGEIFILDNKKCGLEGLKGFKYNGTPVSVDNIKTRIKKAEITLRDINKGKFNYFFEKEIHQASESIFKTLKGKYLINNKEEYQFNLDNIISLKIKNRIKDKKIKKIYIIGQGTAGIAGYGIAYRMRKILKDKINVQPLKSSELSGYYLKDNMEDTLVIAVSQSGTTTDTNRAVDLAKNRGALTLGIVNRRNSHLTRLVDSVFYTSDGRDIEMSVASTKAFYSQLVAGEILSLYLGDILGTLTKKECLKNLNSLKNLPILIDKVLNNQEIIKNIKKISSNLKKYQHWSVVGSGYTKISAEEIRIKLSELCYKSISCDYIEDKKHIDLSSEPLIIICSAGLPLSIIKDIAKEAAIFKSHNSCPIVITDEENYKEFEPYSEYLIKVPYPETELSSIIVNTLIGHLIGFYSALSINEEAKFFIKFRKRIVDYFEKRKSIICDSIKKDFKKDLEEFNRDFHYRRRQGFFNSSLPSQLCSEISLTLLYSLGKIPYSFIKDISNLGDIYHLLLETFNKAINLLLRPIDAIKHQAKTVTVGTSRLEFKKLTGIIFDNIFSIFNINNLRCNIIERIKELQEGIQEIKGFSLYKILEENKIQLIRREGIAKEINSRAIIPIPLGGTKKSVVEKEEIFHGLGVKDKRPLIIVPIYSLKDNNIEYLFLMHITFKNKVSTRVAKNIISPYFDDIKNRVEEYGIEWKDEYLNLVSPKDLYCSSKEEIASIIINSILYSK